MVTDLWRVMFLMAYELRSIGPRLLTQAHPPLCLNPHRAKGSGEGFPPLASARSFLDGLPVHDHDHRLSLREWMRTRLKLFWSCSLMTWTERFLRPSMCRYSECVQQAAMQEGQVACNFQKGRACLITQATLCSPR